MQTNEDLFLRQMPHSLEAEQAVLGSMLIDADCVKLVMDKLRPADFYLETNRGIFETIYSMFSYGKPIDGLTVADELKKAGRYDENTTRSYLAQLMEITPTSANVQEYADIVRSKALLREMRRTSSEWCRTKLAKPRRFLRPWSRGYTQSAATRTRRE